MADSLETTSAIDLVERLRAYKPYSLNDEWFTPPLVTEAADTIARLQAALTEFVQARDAYLKTDCGSHVEHLAANRLDAAHENARKAVGGE